GRDQATERELARPWQRVGREPAQLVDVVRGLRLTRAEPSRPEQVQRRAPVVVTHPDPEEPCNVELETCFLAHLAPQTVEWMFSLTDESTDDVPRSPKRLARAPREQDSTALLRKRACSHGGVRVVHEFARAAFDETVPVRKLVPAARARRPTVEHTHGVKRCTINQSRPKKSTNSLPSAWRKNRRKQALATRIRSSTRTTSESARRRCDRPRAVAGRPPCDALG